MRGGMGSLTTALAASAENFGATIRCAVEVAGIEVESGRATGVELADGATITAETIFSNADPKRTFLTLLDERALPDDFVSQVRAIEMDGCVMKINCALAELLDYLALPGTDPGPQHRGTVDICPSLADLDAAFTDAQAGEPSRRPFMEVYIQSAAESGLAPGGMHVMSIFAQYAPSRLAAGTWDDREVLSPVDLERRFYLTGGNIFHGEIVPGQLFSDRPVHGWSQYRTPIDGLYLCGAGAHPGGGVMGAPGYNAAARYLADERSKGAPGT